MIQCIADPSNDGRIERLREMIITLTEKERLALHTFYLPICRAARLRPQSHKSHSLPVLWQLEWTSPLAQDWLLFPAHIQASQQYPFSLCVSVELNAAILELIERSRFRRNESVCVKLNRIQQVYNSTQFLEVVKGLTQQNEQVNVADYVSSVVRHRPVQNQALKP